MLICVTGFLLDIASLPGAELDVTEKGSRVPVNAQALVNKDSPTFSLAVNQYRQLLLALVLDKAKRQQMGRRAVEYARTRTWEEAMGCLMKGEAQVERCCCQVLIGAWRRLSGSRSAHASEEIEQASSHIVEVFEHFHPLSQKQSDRRPDRRTSRTVRRRRGAKCNHFGEIAVRQTAPEAPPSPFHENCSPGFDFAQMAESADCRSAGHG
jgi:hypothetical protein